MELVDPFEACDGDWSPSRIGWLSPRVSFSEDFVMLDRTSPEKRKREQQQDDFSSEFEFCRSVGVEDLTSMLPADELFFDGKVRSDRIVHEESKNRARRDEVRLIEREGGLRGGDYQHLRSFYENPRCSSMIVEGVRELPPRSCISLDNSTYPSPSRSSSLPPTTPSSPKASSSKNSTKFKEFLKLHVPRITRLPPFDLPRESSASSSRRMPISFWPFSRSNSAGESKRTPEVSPQPRRSNSAGENKTSKPSLLLSSGNVASGKVTSEGKANMPRPPQSSQAKKGLPPRSTSTAKRSSGNHSFLIPLNCSTHAVALSSQSVSLSTPVSSHPSSSIPICGPSTIKRVHKSGRQMDSVATAKSSGGDHQTMSDSSLNTGRFSSHGMPVRMGTTSIPERNLARGSPGRSGVIGRGGGAASKGLGRQLDIWSREAPIAYSPSVRVMPVLNVPVCIGPSFRGARASSKSKMFSLGSFFPKREKEARGDTVLPPDSQSGA